MNYKSTLEMLLNTYPNIFVTEADVLQHLFFTLGNGFEWKNGELCEDYNDVKKIKYEEKDIEQIRKRETIDRARQILLYGGGNVWSINKNGNMSRKLFSSIALSDISNIPNNIAADWLCAAEKAVGLVNSGEFRFEYSCDEDDIKSCEAKIKSIKEVRQK